MTCSRKVCSSCLIVNPLPGPISPIVVVKESRPHVVWEPDDGDAAPNLTPGGLDIPESLTVSIAGLQWDFSAWAPSATQHGVFTGPPVSSGAT